MEQNLTLKSDFQIAKEKREKEVYDYFTELMSVEGAQIGEVNKLVRAKFDIHSDSTVWYIRKRVKARLKDQKTK